MKDAFGAPQSLLVLGGSSDIGRAVARRLIARRTRRIHLAGRPSPRLTEAAAELTALGAEVTTVHFDAATPETHEDALGKVFADGDVDCVVLAFGVLGDQTHDETHPRAAARIANVNYTGAVSAALTCANALRAQGHGSLVVLSSVAGQRARRANFIYGSTKAGLDAFAQGLGDALHGTGVHVMVVRPGFVRTRMTAGMAAAPFATTPEAVARAVEQGLRHGSHTVWAPQALRYLMTAVRHLPRSLHRRLPR